MSVLKVDSIQTTAGAAPTTKDLGFAAGSVVQMQVSRYSGNSPVINNSSYTTLNRSVTITPKYADSIILVRYSASAYVQSGVQVYATFYRNGTNLYNQSGYNTNASHQGLTQFYSETGTSFFPSTLEFADTPNSTSALTYALYAKKIGGPSSSDAYWPPGSVDTATFTAMEIAQ
tara:strand:+ start:1237 stop:1758 length:522 start_codon:yes stop_codon:yes gene_type:complete